jgi:hypothetical protein
MDPESSLREYFLLELKTCNFVDGKDAARDYVMYVTNQIVASKSGVIADGEVGRRFRDADEEWRSDFLGELRFQLAEYGLKKELCTLVTREHSEDGLNILYL